MRAMQSHGPGSDSRELANYDCRWKIHSEVVCKIDLKGWVRQRSMVQETNEVIQENKDDRGQAQFFENSPNHLNTVIPSVNKFILSTQSYLTLFLPKWIYFVIMKKMFRDMKSLSSLYTNWQILPGVNKYLQYNLSYHQVLLKGLKWTYSINRKGEWEKMSCMCSLKPHGRKICHISRGTQNKHLCTQNQQVCQWFEQQATVVLLIWEKTEIRGQMFNFI